MNYFLRPVLVAISLFAIGIGIPRFAPAGHHVMYDIFASIPYFADGYLDPVHKMQTEKIHIGSQGPATDSTPAIAKPENRREQRKA